MEIKSILKKNVDVSIVIPAFCENKNLIRLYEELLPIINENGKSFEVIFIDDGSKDDTWEVIKEIHLKDPRIEGVRFSRNFGHQYALLAGFNFASGAGVITMDADLQHPPNIIPKLIEEWEKGFKIVNTVRTYSENISWFKKRSSDLYYKIFSYLSGTELKPGMADFRLIDRVVINELLKMKENGFFIRGLVNWMGFPNTSVKFMTRDRLYGKSKYTLRKMIKFAWTGLVSFSIIPLRMGIVLGLVTSGLAFYQLIDALYAFFILKTTVPGWTSTTVIMTILFGVLFILIGLIGEYISRILLESRDRPRFIVQEQVGFEINHLNQLNQKSQI